MVTSRHRFIKLPAVVLVAAWFGMGALSAPANAAEKITIFAAASMKNALDNVDAAWTKQTGKEVVVSYAASSALAKQLESGAPADVFISADTDWMDYVAKKKLIRPGTRRDLLTNKLALIAPANSKLRL